MKHKYTIKTDLNRDRCGNPVLPKYCVEVWLGDRFVDRSVGWKVEDCKEHAIKLADERLAREAKS
jgi:hypothetical protein